MSFIRRNWTPREADEWTKEDTLTAIISPLTYALLMIGTALSLFLLPVGFITLGLGLILMFCLIYIINPKLDAISQAYEQKQKQYLLELEKKIKWEEEP